MSTIMLKITRGENTKKEKKKAKPHHLSAGKRPREASEKEGRNAGGEEKGITQVTSGSG